MVRRAASADRAARARCAHIGWCRSAAPLVSPGQGSTWAGAVREWRGERAWVSVEEELSWWSRDLDDYFAEGGVALEMAVRRGNLVEGKDLVDDRPNDITQRSEERRVGKECRSRWWPNH